MIVGIDPELAMEFSLNKEALKLISSETMKQFLDSEEYNLMIHEEGVGNSFPNWSYMQLATIAFQFLRGKKRVKFLKDLADNCPEIEIKVLLRKAAKDFAKNKYRAYKGRISPKTLEYYDKIRKPGDPTVPFAEIMFYPNIFKKGDVVSYRNWKNKKQYFIIWGVPDYEKDYFLDESDERICVIMLEGMNDILNDEKMFAWHNHMLPSELNIVEDEKIPTKYCEVVASYRDKYCKEEEKPRTIVNVHTKQEMWERAKDLLELATVL